MSRDKKNQNASKRGTIETSSLRFARSKPQKLATVIVGLFSLKENAPTKNKKGPNIDPCGMIKTPRFLITCLNIHLQS